VDAPLTEALFANTGHDDGPNQERHGDTIHTVAVTATDGRVFVTVRPVNHPALGGLSGRYYGTVATVNGILRANFLEASDVAML